MVEVQLPLRISTSYYKNILSSPSPSPAIGILSCPHPKPPPPPSPPRPSMSPSLTKLKPLFRIVCSSSASLKRNHSLVDDRVAPVASLNSQGNGEANWDYVDTLDLKSLLELNAGERNHSLVDDRVAPVASLNSQGNGEVASLNSQGNGEANWDYVDTLDLKSLLELNAGGPLEMKNEERFAEEASLDIYLNLQNNANRIENYALDSKRRDQTILVWSTPNSLSPLVGKWLRGCLGLQQLSKETKRKVGLLLTNSHKGVANGMSFVKRMRSSSKCKEDGFWTKPIIMGRKCRGLELGWGGSPTVRAVVGNKVAEASEPPPMMVVAPLEDAMNDDDSEESTFEFAFY